MSFAIYVPIFWGWILLLMYHGVGLQYLAMTGNIHDDDVCSFCFADTREGGTHARLALSAADMTGIQVVSYESQHSMSIVCLLQTLS